LSELACSQSEQFDPAHVGQHLRDILLAAATTGAR
jgi:hypothetical protein